MPEIGRLLRRAFRIDQRRQVAAQPHRIHRFEKEGAVTAEQVLHVVLRGREQHIDIGLVHEAVEPIHVERDGRNALADVEHEQNSLVRNSYAIEIEPRIPAGRAFSHQDDQNSRPSRR